MIRRGFIIDLPHIISMCMLIISCPSLFESKFCIIFSISFSVNVISDKDLWVLVSMKDRISLPLSVIEHCLAKKEWNNSAFSLELVTNLLSWKINGIQGILLLTDKSFGTCGWIHFFSIKENNLCLDVSEEIENFQTADCCYYFF